MGDTSETIIGSLFIRDGCSIEPELEMMELEIQNGQGTSSKTSLTIEQVKQLHWFVHSWLSAHGIKTTKGGKSE